jgi:hypothetical protein
LVLLVLLVTAAALTACSGDDSAAPRRRPSTSTSSTSGSSTTTSTLALTAPPPPPRRFTVTGSRAGFAHGYELVRRDSPADVEADLDLMASTGARWLRVGIGWGHVESSPGVYDWAPTDRLVLGARRRGLSMVAVVASAPGWDSAPGCHQFECAPADPGPFAEFLRVAAQRYAPLGVRDWEIWNEPNHVQFWGPRPDPVAYTELLRRASLALAAVDPGLTVITGGLSPAPNRDGEIAPLTFLRRVYELGGGSYFDAVAHHPYQFPSPPTAPSDTNAFLQTEQIHELMDKFGDGAKKIWGTEVGAPTRGSQSVSEADQAAWLDQYYGTWNRWSFTGPLLWYTARDKGRANNIDDSFGLVRANRTRKPAFAAFEEMINSSEPVAQPTTRH